MTLLDELIERSINEAEDLLNQYKKKVELVRELKSLREDIHHESGKKKD